MQQGRIDHTKVALKCLSPTLKCHSSRNTGRFYKHNLFQGSLFAGHRVLGSSTLAQLLFGSRPIPCSSTRGSTILHPTIRDKAALGLVQN